VWGIIENKKYYKLHGTYNRNKIIFPIKVIGGGLILLEILKIVVYAVDPNKFIPDILPFHYSDYVIFVLAAFAFSKKNTTINRLSFINFMALGGITLISMLVAPTYIVVFKDLYENFVYKTIHGFITHYFIFYSFL
jgi:hypothetical protein